MGGPCVFDSDGSAVHNYAPACTDNFQVYRGGSIVRNAHSFFDCTSQVVHARFMFDGFMYLSCEQAFQAAKFAKQSPARHAIEAAVPKDGESDEEFGNTCWCMGQGSDDRRADWDVVKIKVMLAVNRAKYAQHKELQLQLLSTLPSKLHGNPGTTSWTHCGKYHSW